MVIQSKCNFCIGLVHLDGSKNSLQIGKINITVGNGYKDAFNQFLGK